MTPAKQPLPAAASHRVAFLDGVRGWASLMVVFSHLGACFLALNTPAYRHWYFAFISDGNLAVYIFFVLSGFALSIRFVQTENPRIPVELALRRYPRLTLPIFAASALAYALMKLHLFFNVAASTPAHGEEWLGTFYRFEPTLSQFLKFTLYQVYFHYEIPTSYDQVLWTMSTEFVGSMLVFFLCLILPYLRYRWIVLGLVGGVMLATNSFLLPFVLGLAMAFAFETRVRREYDHSLLALAASLALILAAAAYSPISFKGFPTIHAITVRNTFPTTIFAALFVFGVSLSARVRGFFSNPLSRYLGSISFPLYLMHTLVICSFSSWLFLRGTNVHVNLLASLAVCLLSADLFKYVERASIRLARLCSDALMQRLPALAERRTAAALR
jgi:peptidoglycan/LPS O-acetylase OafA/YrhL